MRLAPESVTSGRLALPVAEPEVVRERERVAEVTVELTPAEGLMVAEAEAGALVIMLDLALLRAEEAEEAADEVADEAEDRAEETESSSSEPPVRGNWAE
jgi:hypothetical protein